MNYFLGVDIGNTKSQAVIINQTGDVVGFGSAGLGNWEVIGWDGAWEIQNRIVNQAIRNAKISTQDIKGAGFGIAGLDWDEDLAGHEEIATQMHLGGPFRCVNDAIIGSIPNIPNDWVVEIPTIVNKDGFSPLPTKPMPYDIFGLVAAVKSFEKLTVEAAIHGDFDAAYQALLVHPLGPSADKIKNVLEDLIEVNQEYLPQFLSRLP